MYSKRKKSQKTARSTGDKSVDRIINDVYNEINKLNDSVKSSYKSEINTRDGNPGDIRIVQDKSFDSDPREDKREFYIEGKTDEGWVRQVMDRTDHSGVSRDGTIPYTSFKVNAKTNIKQGALSFWKTDSSPKFSVNKAFSQGIDVYINENVIIGKNATKNLEVTGTLKLASPVNRGSSSGDVLVFDSSDKIVKKRTMSELLSDLGIAADEILDWTADQGSSNIHANNIVITHNQVTDFDSEVNTLAQVKIDALIDSAPGALDTLNELAAALNDDASFATTVTNSIATKVGLTGNETVAGVKTFSSSLDLTGVPSDPGDADTVRIGRTSGYASEILQINSNDGYLKLGAYNASYCHFVTDRPMFYFNQDIAVDTGLISSFNEDLIIRRVFNDTSYNQITLGDDSFELKLDNTARLNVDGDGKVGIGTASPSEMLHLKGAGDVKILLEADTDNTTETDNPEIMFSQDGGAVTGSIGFTDVNDLRITNAYNHDEGDIHLQTRSTTRMSVLGNGDVGIGTTSPSVRLHVDSSTSDTVAIFKSSDSTARIQIQDDDTTNHIVSNNSTLSLGANNTTHAGNLNIDSNGRLGVGVTDPDSKVEIIGEGDSNSTKSLEIKDSGGTNLFYVRDDGVVSVTHNYLFVQSGGIYSTYAIRARGGVTDDGGALGLGSGGSTDHLIINSGNVGIGAAAASTLLEVQGGLTTTGAVMTLSTKEPTVVANDVLGRINFQAPLDTGADSDLVGASIVAIAEDTFSDTVNSTSLQFQTGTSETATTRMTIDETGNVGIGTASPQADLHINSTSGTALYITSSDSNPTNSGSIRFAEIADGSNYYVEQKYNGNSNKLSFNSEAVSDILTIMRTGNVGIKTATPSQALEVTGNIMLRSEGGIFVENLGSPTGSSTGYGGSLLIPAKGMYRSSASSQTGAIKIHIPRGTGDASDWISMWVDVTDYATDESFSAYIQGYMYKNEPGSESGDTEDHEWTNETAMIFAKKQDRDFTVSYGHDDTDWFVAIGAVDSTWSYLQVTVRDVQIGGSSDIDDYTDDWDITLVTNFGTTVHQAHTDNFPVVKGTNITELGTITTGTWNGGVIASAYLDSDTAHLSGTQTFSGAKTFSATTTMTSGAILSGTTTIADARITMKDTRSTYDAPDVFNKEVRFEFKQSSAIGGPSGIATYGGLMTIAPWGDSSGDAHHQLFFIGNDSTTTNGGIFWRTGDPGDSSTSDWGDFKQILTTLDAVTIIGLLNSDLGGDFTIGNQSNDTGTFAGHLAIGGNITAGAITSGFGNINIGSSTLDAGATILSALRVGDSDEGIRLLNIASNISGIYGVDTAGSGWNSIHIKADGEDGLFIEKDTNKVGIGTTSPGSTLHISDASSSGVTSLSLNNRVKVRGDGVVTWGSAAAHGTLSWDSGKTLINSQGTNDLQISAGGNHTDHIYIDGGGSTNDGCVGIGTNSPDEKLHVVGDLKVVGNISSVSGGATIGDSAADTFRTTGHTYLATVGNNVGIGNTSPNHLLHVGDDVTATFGTAPDKAIQLSSSTNDHEIAYILYAGEGTNNIRSKYYVDDATKYVGWDSTHSTGWLGYEWKVAGTQQMQLNTSGNLTVKHGGWNGITVQNTANTNGSHIELKNTERRFQVAVRSNGFDIRDVTASDTSRLSISSAGTFNFNNNNIINIGDVEVDKVLGAEANNVFTTYTTGGIASEAESGDTIAFNALQNNVDFQVDGENTVNLLYVDASTDRVGIGTATPEETFDIKDTSNNHQLQLTAATNMNSGIKFSDGTDADSASIYYYHTDKRLRFYTDNTEQMNILANGNIGMGTDSPSVNLHVKDDSGSNTLETIRVENSNGYAELGAQSTYARILAGGNLTYAANNSASYFYIGGSTKAGLTSTGLGVGIAAPTTTLDVEGTVSYKHTAFSTAGPTDAVDVSDTTVLEVDTSSNNVVIGGFTGGVQGQILYIVKTDTANFIQLEFNESPASGTHQKIFTTSGIDERVVGYGGYTLYCNGTNWFSLSNPTGAADAG